MLYVQFIFNLVLYIIFINAGFIQDKLFDGVVMHIDRLDPQCRGKNVPCKGFFQGVKTISTKISIENCTIIVTEEDFKKVMLTITITRCRSKENLDTCEEYFKQSNIDFCKAIDPDNPIVSKNPFYVPFEPRIKCPIKKGVYYGYNISYDLAPFVFFELEGWYWRLKTELFSEENRLLFCNYIDGYVTNSKFKTN